MEKELESFYAIVKKRRSVREFDSREIEEEKLQRILEVGWKSASAANCQPWHFVVIRKENREEINSVFYKPGFKTAPVIIAACVDSQKAWVRKDDQANFSWVDVSIALTEMILAATAEGLGSCWVAAFDLEKAKKILSIPEGIDLVTLVAFGYPVQPLTPGQKVRKKKEEILHYGKW